MSNIDLIPLERIRLPVTRTVHIHVLYDVPESCTNDKALEDVRETVDELKEVYGARLIEELEKIGAKNVKILTSVY